jgi:phosphoglycerate dehydrogenase-like enzyme
VTILVLIQSPFRMWRIPPGHVARLREAFPAHTFVHALDDREALSQAASVEAAFSSQIGPAILEAAPRLRWIHSPAAGVAGMLYPALLDRSVVLTNSRGLAADTIAEHVIAVTLALCRRLPLAFSRQSQHVWAQDEIGDAPGKRTIAGARITVLGLGAIGSAAAVRLHALGATVTGLRRRLDAPVPPGVTEVRSVDELPEVLPSADVLVIAAPQTPSTRGLIGRPEVARMKRGSLLVNVSRGGLVDEPAVIEALREGALGGAALDVFNGEPLGAGSPLWDVPNLLITPHTAGFSPDHWDRAVDLFADNLRRFERGEPLLNVVDKSAGY